MAVRALARLALRWSRYERDRLYAQLIVRMIARAHRRNGFAWHFSHAFSAVPHEVAVRAAYVVRQGFPRGLIVDLAPEALALDTPPHDMGATDLWWLPALPPAAASREFDAKARELLKLG
jgi:hypothetical protein